MNLTVDNTTSDEYERKLLKIVNASIIAESDDLRELEKQDLIVTAVVGDIISGIQRCVDFRAADPPSSYTSSSTSTSTSTSSTSTPLPFEESIMRENIPRNNNNSTNNITTHNLLKFSHWRKGSVQQLMLDNTQQNLEAGTNKIIRTYTSGSEEASRALECLTSCFLSIDQMLQLRFQMRGSAHFEMLGYRVGRQSEESVGGSGTVGGVGGTVGGVGVAVGETVGETGTESQGQGQGQGVEGGTRTDGHISGEDIMTPEARYEVNLFIFKFLTFSSLISHTHV